MQQRSLGGGHGGTQIALPLVLQEQIDGRMANAQNFLEHTAFEIVQRSALPNRLSNPIGEPIRQCHEDFALAHIARRCDDHATASMRVVLVCIHQHDTEAGFCLSHVAQSPKPVRGRTVTPLATSSQTFDWYVSSIFLGSFANQKNLNGDVVSIASDASAPTGDTLAFSATGLPAGITINSSGVISGTIGSGADAYSPYSVTITATDTTTSATASQTFSWYVNEIRLTKPVEVAYYDGDAVAFSVTASAAYGNSIRFRQMICPPALP